MNLILNVPVELRLAVLFVLGALVGSLINLGIYRFSWVPRPISPWSQPHPKAPARRWSDRLPIVGWFGLRREARLHGRGFWIRPLVVELVSAVGLAALYWWETLELGHLPILLAQQPPPGMTPASRPLLAVHMNFVAHALLFALMAVAALIDADEKIVPDAITLPGTLAGLALAAVYPWSLLPGDVVVIPPGPNLPAGQLLIDFLRLTSRSTLWPEALNGAPRWTSLALALACYSLWCFALLPRPWRTRHGYRRALGLMSARIARDRFSRLIGLVWLAGIPLIALVWWLGGVSWQGLLTSLIGVIGGAGVIWSVRILGSAALGREAMGFGDVTFMAMVGAFVGWQASLIIFFLAPLAAVLIGLLQWILRREHELPYAPYLALATLALVVRWPDFWLSTVDIFAVGWLVPAAFAVCLVLMFGMLWAMSKITGRR